MFRDIFKQYWKSILFICALLYLSFAKPSTFKEAPTFFSLDKLVHLVLYFIFGIVLILDFLKTETQKATTKLKVLITVVFPIVLGGIIEVLQDAYFKPRSAEWIDWLSDILGIVLSYIFMHYLFKRLS